MPFGAEVLPDGVRFRVWAPSVERIGLSLEGPEISKVLPMEAAGDGWFELESTEARPGSRYRFVLESGMHVPDPVSRFNPADVHSASMVVDPTAFDWQDGDWRGQPWEDAVIYELQGRSLALLMEIHQA